MKTNLPLGKIFAVGLFSLTVTVHGAPQVLSGHIPTIINSLQPSGLLPETNHLNLAIALPLRNQAGLSNLLKAIYDPSSPKYHHYLTPEQFAEQFGPAESDYQAVIAFANAHGLTVSGVHPNRLLLDVDAPVKNIENALHVTFHTYRHPTENRTFYSSDREPSLDLSVPILHISGLNDYSLPRPCYVIKSLANGQAVAPNADTGSGPQGTYIGHDFRTAYAPDTALNGSGQVVGLLQFDGYSSNDIAYYERAAGLPAVTLSNVLVNGATGNPSGGGGAVEASLDIEMAISMATNLAKVMVYEAPNPSPFVDLLNRMATDNQAKQLSCSWYVPNGTAEPAADLIFEQMAAQGQTFFAASGDSDAYTGLIPFPGDTPYITEVGGTTLTLNGESYGSETVWNWGGGIGTGGGVSTQYPIPSWQTNISMTANQGSTTMRNIPDVAMTADNVYVRAYAHDYLNVGGTSCAAPLWAGFMALVNQEATASGKPAVGFINPAVDAIGSGANYNACFHDIVSGNNTWNGSPAKFYAVSGYDLCTGWGTPAGQRLIDALANPEPLVITPPSGFSSAGGYGGPFTIKSQTLTLTNAGTNALTWSLSNTSLWLNVSATGGILFPGGPATNVTVSLNSAASNLVVGLYSAELWFTNLTDGDGQSRNYNVSIISPPTITMQPTNQSVLEGQSTAFNVTAAGGQPLAYQWQANGTNLSDDENIFGSATTNLMIRSVSETNAGNYTVMVTNIAGTAMSSNALLTIIPSPPIIIMQPSNRTVVVDSTVTFSVAVVGTTPYSFQWSLNDTNISGATNATLILPDVQFSDAGNYSVTITNIYGSTNSVEADLTVLPCDPAPTGLVDWWQGEGDASDSIGTNNGTLVGGAGFAAGEVGEAFSFNGSDYVSIPDSPSLDALTNQITVECWIKANSTDANSDWEGIITKDNSSWRLQATAGAQTVTWSVSGVTPTVDMEGNRNVNDGQWHHVAGVYDGTNMYLYVDGTLDVSQAATGTISQNNEAICLGNTIGAAPGHAYLFNGLIDEASIYNRALTASEIQAIYLAGSKGKCPPAPTPPSIITQPTSQTNLVGATVSFSVVAAGTKPLSYQWSFDTTNIINATNAALTLTNVQFNQAGNYSVAITNFYGSTNSATALLTVNPLPPCDPVPTGLVDWWQGEGDASDSIGTNNGTLVGGAGFAAGEVGEAFSFNGSDYVSIPDSPSLDGFTNKITVEAWIKANSTNANSDWEGIITKGNAWRLQATSGAKTISWNSGVIGISDLTCNRNVNDGQWHHVAGVYDGTNMYLYVDGTLDASQAATGMISQNNYALCLGANSQGPFGSLTYLFNGLIDEPSIYNRALSASEVQAIYLAGSNGKCPPAPTPPSILMQPMSQTNLIGATVSFGVVAAGTKPLRYQWSFDTTNIDGATNAALTLTNVQFSQAGNYSVTITNFYGSTNSAVAVLTVNPLPPCDPAPTGLVDWWQGEGDATDNIGTNNGTLAGGVTFSPGKVGLAFSFNGNDYVSVPDSPSLDVLTNQITVEAWIKANSTSANADWEGIITKDNSSWRLQATSGAKTLTWTVSGATGGDMTGSRNINDGQWHHVAGVYDGTNQILYVDGTVDVSKHSTGAISTNNAALCLGNTIGAAPGHAYLFNGLIDEASIYNRALTASEIQAIYLAGSAGKCAVPPTIISQPTNQLVAAGVNVSFSVSVSGSRPFFYQWTFNGTNILNATNAMLLLTNVQVTQAGIYAVQIANTGGSVISSNAVLVINGAPLIITQPVSQTNYVGTTATFSASAVGPSPLTYLWNFGTTNIQSDTNATLTLTNLQFSQAGIYSVLVTNAYGSVLSSNAALVINPFLHFVWNSIPSPRFSGAPISVTVQAEDPTNQLVIGFTNTVAFSTTNCLSIYPTLSGNFVQGIWTGAVAVVQTGSNVVLAATDTYGETGWANPINIVATPALTVTPSGSTLFVFWPIDPSGFALETSPDLVNWSPVAVPPIQIGNQYLEPISISGTNAFYRLQFNGE